MLLFDANFFKLELKLGAINDDLLVQPSSKSHDSLCLICRLGVLGIENTSRYTSRLVDDCLGGSESRLTAFNFRDSVGVLGDWISRIGWVQFIVAEASVSCRVGKLRSFFSSMGCPSILARWGSVKENRSLEDRKFCKLALTRFLNLQFMFYYCY